jgi:hypothetical protein
MSTTTPTLTHSAYAGIRHGPADRHGIHFRQNGRDDCDSVIDPPRFPPWRSAEHDHCPGRWASPGRLAGSTQRMATISGHGLRERLHQLATTGSSSICHGPQPFDLRARDRHRPYVSQQGERQSFPTILKTLAARVRRPVRHRREPYLRFLHKPACYAIATLMDQDSPGTTLRRPDDHPSWSTCIDSANFPLFYKTLPIAMDGIIGRRMRTLAQEISGENGHT